MSASKLPPLSSLRAFEAAARLQSFKAAAQELSVTATAISHRIRVLEQWLGVALFVRQTRAVALSREGAVLFRSVRMGFEELAQGVAAVQVGRQARVTISATPAFTTKWLVPRLADFQSRFPEIDLQVHASNQPVDLMSGSVDMAIRYGDGNYPGLQAMELLQDRFSPVAAPRLQLASATLESWPLIHFDWHQRLRVDLTWAAWAKAAGCSPEAFLAGIHYSEESHAIQAAVAGQGVALLSVLLVEQELAMGLLQVLRPPALPGLAYHLVRAEQRYGAAADKVWAWLQEVSQ